MASDAHIQDRHQKILSAALKFVADVNEDLRLESVQDDASKDPRYDEQLEEVGNCWRQEERERKEAADELLRSSAAIDEKEQELRVALHAFVTQTQLNRDDISRLQEDCARLRSQQQLTEQQKDDILQRLSRTIEGLQIQRLQSHDYAQQVSYLNSLIVTVRRQADDRNEEATSQMFSLGQKAEQYRREVEAKIEELREQERQCQDRIELENSARISRVASLELEKTKMQQENEEAAQETLEQNTQLQDRLTTLQKEKQAAEEQLAECENQAAAEVDSLKQKVADSKEKMLNLRQQLTNTETKLQDQLSETAESQLDLKNARKEKSQTLKENSKMRKRLLTIHEEKTAIEAGFAELEQQASTKSRQISRLKQKLADAKAEKERLTEVETHLRQRLASLEQVLANMQEEKNECGEKAKGALKCNSDLYEQLNASHKEQKIIEKQSEEREQRLAAEMTSREQELADTKAEIGHLQERLATAEANLEGREDTRSTDTQTDSSGASAVSDDNAGLPPDGQVTTVAALRTRLAALISAASDRSTPGVVVVTEEYTRSCLDFAAGRSDTVPGPLQCPDLIRTYATFNDVTYLSPEAGRALCAMMGGTPAVTVGEGHAWYCDDHLAFRYTQLFNEHGDELEIPGRENDDVVCHLPVILPFSDALHQYLGYNPSAVMDVETEGPIEPSTLVGGWRTETNRLDLIVFKN